MVRAKITVPNYSVEVAGETYTKASGEFECPAELLNSKCVAVAEKPKRKKKKAESTNGD